MTKLHGAVAVLAIGALSLGAPRSTDTLAAQGAAVPASDGDTQLLPGVAVEATVSSTSGATFLLSLNAGEAVEISAAQENVNLRLRLEDSGGQQIGLGSLRAPQQGDERLHAIATSSGDHRLTVDIAGGAPVEDARIIVIVDAIRQADERDRVLSDAARAYAQADAEMARGTGDAVRSALPLFRQAVAAWASVGARFEQATGLNRIGLGEMQLSNLQDALTALEESGRLRREIGDRYGEGVALNNIAATHMRLGNYETAGTLYAQAIELRRAIDDRGGLGWSLLGLGTARSRVTDGWSSANDDYREALAIFEEVRDERGVGEALYSLGYGHKQLNEFDTATEYFERALKLRTERNDLAGQASVLTQVAAIHLQLGDTERALDILDTSLALRRRAGDRRGEAYTVQTVGVALTRLGHYAKALEPLTEALRIFEDIGDREGQTSALMHTAALHIAAGKPAPALEFARRGRALMEGQHNLAGAIFLSVAGDAQVASTLLGDAVASYERALVESERLGEALPAARALAGLGRVARARGDLAASRRHLLDALDRIESVRASVAQSELQSSFLGIAQTTYESAIETLIALHRHDPSAGYAAEALLVGERKRARAMLDMLAEARANLRSGADTTLLEREDAIQRALNARTAAGAASLAEAGGRAAREDEEAVATLVADLRAVRGEIRTRNPKYAALVHPPLLDLAGIQRLLDPETLLLEYSLGERESYVWAITPDAMTLHELPGRATIERGVRRARDLIVRSAQRSARGPLRQALADLSAMVLGGIAHQLERKRLVIVADGVLQFLPFAALPAPDRAGATVEEEPLMVTHEIVMLPSASVANVLRQSQTEPDRSTRKTVAVLADPVFEADDPRVTAREGDRASTLMGHAPSTRNEPSRDLVRAAASAGVSQFERLPQSREEAVAIAARVGRAAGLTALGFDATRELALSPMMDGHHIVHFATHTVLDTRHPEISGIVLTLVDRDGRNVDGFLRLHDIFNMKLSAEVVVLSACRTALGQDVRGEGLIGLARGFMHAGASQVVASLWDVRDRSTAALMTELYTGLLQRGLTAPAALRAAQIAMWQNPRWRMPVHWAGFIVQGDWRAGR